MFPEKYFLISDYEDMELLGVKGLFTNGRVDSSSLPEGFYKYSLREGEDDFISSVKETVLVNHMGDFVCKQELDLKGEDEYELYGDYNFTGDDVDLDDFFGVDIKLKVAEALDGFCHDFDPYEYQDTIPTGCSREDVVATVRAGLDDKAYVEGAINYLRRIVEANEMEAFLEPEVEQTAYSLVSVLEEFNEHNRDALDIMVDKANKMKEEQANGAKEQSPEIQQ